ncbi:hypothetical protein AVEN_110090-1 [Araneus ventricosus]|uniref:Uncharacterized protein n=1 Tax=Araneus ventricosus TaxID=182803 RepID=A0A4Y2PPL4_ARAVE|nr:hypothetical protein AVEN_110090-1 [Araneus ventricosus]
MKDGLARKGVRSLAEKLEAANNKNRPVKSNEEEIARKELVRLFMARQAAKLCIRKPKKTNLSMSSTFKPSNVENSLKNFEDVYICLEEKYFANIYWFLTNFLLSHF